MPNSSFIHILGHAGKDAVLRPVGDTQVANFSVAYSRKRKDKESTTWFDVSVWGKTATFIAENVKKGDPVAVMGELYQEAWGEGKVSLRIDAQNVALLKGRDAERGKDKAATAAAGGAQEERPADEPAF
jgi:single-strand DNA-binding protein